jgi:hypothetical protein
MDNNRDPQDLAAQNMPFRRDPAGQPGHGSSVQIGGYARASYASGGGGASRVASRVPRIAGDVTAGSALVSCVLVGYAPCAERRRF